MGFRVVKNKEEIQKLSEKIHTLTSKGAMGKENAEYYKDDKVFYQAPVVIFILTQKSIPTTFPIYFSFLPLMKNINLSDYYWGSADAAIASQNIALTATALGLGTTFIGIALSLNSDDTMLRELGVPDGDEIAACIIVGHPENKDQIVPSRKPPRILCRK